MATTTIRVQATDIPVSVQALIDATNVNVPKMLDSVNSYLAQLAQEGLTECTAKASVKSGGKDKPDVFVLKEKQLSKFTGGVTNPGRFYLFCQHIADLEKHVGVIPLKEWPAYLTNWAVKMSS